jgi:hypothetical protein
MVRDGIWHYSPANENLTTPPYSPYIPANQQATMFLFDSTGAS